MRVIKIQGSSIEKQKLENERQSFPKRSLKVRRRVLVESQGKKVLRQPYESLQQAHNNNKSPQQIQSDAVLCRVKGLMAESSGQERTSVISEQKNTNKSEVRLPILILGKVTIITRNDSASKQQTSEIIQGLLENRRREQNMTFHGRSIPKYALKSQKGSMKGQSVEPIFKLMKIQSLKPSYRVPASDNQLSLRQIEIQKIERTCPILRGNQGEGVQNLELKTDIISGKKHKKNSLVHTTTQIPLKKQRRVLSIVKQSSNPKKKFTISYLDFCLFISLSNKMERPAQPTATYKAFVGKGNNSILIKTTLKNRFWWNVIDSENDVNLHWTQHRDNKFLKTLKSYDTENISIPQSKEGKKRNQFLLQGPSKQNEKTEPTKKHTRQGLHRLISVQNQQTFSQNCFHAVIPNSHINGRFEQPNKIKIHNHLEFNWHLCNKKALYYNMRAYYRALKQDPFQYIPLTFHVQKENDQEWVNFEQKFRDKQEDLKASGKKKQKNLWIIKPGQNSNRGCGINVSDSIQQIGEIVRTKGVRPNGGNRSHIIQKYLMPLLYNKRKFDIRCYVLITSVNNILKAYWYEEGYIRTSSRDFNTKNLKNRIIHLTNDAIQKKSEQYGKYENGNKVSFNDFQKYIENSYPDKQGSFYDEVYPKMMKLAADCVKSTYLLLDANKRQFSFEILGLDFMIDEDFNTWLIEVNNNPCLELSSPLLARIVPNMVENAFRIAIDPLFPPPKQYPKSKAMLSELFEANKFSLIFDSEEQGENLKSLLKGVNLEGIVESDQEQEGIENQEVPE